jgi:catechol-2,3-dioxygenase
MVRQTGEERKMRLRGTGQETCRYIHRDVAQTPNVETVSLYHSNLLLEARADK